MCHSKKAIILCNRKRSKCNTTAEAFTLVEVVAALVILALLSSGVFVVINRCVTSAADSTLRMMAFEVARENMEKLLASDSVMETVDYGNSDKYPEIKWQSVVETFYEPITNRMWIRAVCSAEYNNSQGQTQAVELTHWLTDVTKQQLLQIMEQEGAQLADQIIETIEEAADYAGVDVETIEQWLDDEMLTTEDGSFIKANLDLYMRSNGNPGDEEKGLQVQSIAELSERTKGTTESDGQRTNEAQRQKGNIDPVTGLTYEELDKMAFEEVLELLKSRHGKNVEFK
jgi:prepilin-type N-terminal cleavage/methylation domain-containing protein